MITKMENAQMKNVCFTPVTEANHALIKGASSRLRTTATVVKSALGVSPVLGGAPITDDQYGGQGSRAWSPPV